jgi:prepilin-type processing-associated H-X9-DG protein
MGWSPDMSCLVGSLLTVMLIAVLAAILFPVFAPARVKSSHSLCLSNVKELAFTMLMYAAENSHYLPPAPDWPQATLSLAKHSKLYLCDQDESDGFPAGGGLRCSYAMNKPLGSADLRPLRDRDQIGLLFDGTELFGGQNVAAFRHNDGANVSFVDGHAKWVSEKYIVGALKVPGGTP